jgi:putative ABC transport system permease protein
VIVLSNGAGAEYTSSISPQQAAQIMQAPGIARNVDGNPSAQPMAAVLVTVIRRSDGIEESIILRGSGPRGLAMEPRFRLIEGRMFASGRDELIVGGTAARQYRGLSVGSRVPLRGALWTVVGVYDEGGGPGDVEMMGDVASVRSLPGRGSFQSIAVKLQTPGSFQVFADALSRDPQLSVTALRYRDYLLSQLGALLSIVDFITYLVASVMAVGAVCSALNTMYAAVEGRSREMATLRAIGFRAGPVAGSVLLEALILAIPSGLIGVGAAWLLIDRHDVALGGSFFTFHVGVWPALACMLLATAVGFVGAFVPAVRTVSFPVSQALRAT